MKTLHFAVLAIALVILLVSPYRSAAESPQIKEAPAGSSTALEPQSGPTPQPASSSAQYAFGLSLNQIMVLAVLFAAFVCVAFLMRYWLSPSAPEETESSATSGTQDIIP